MRIPHRESWLLPNLRWPLGTTCPCDSYPAQEPWGEGKINFNRPWMRCIPHLSQKNDRMEILSGLRLGWLASLYGSDLGDTLPLAQYFCKACQRKKRKIGTSSDSWALVINSWTPTWHRALDNLPWPNKKRESKIEEFEWWRLQG